MVKVAVSDIPLELEIVINAVPGEAMSVVVIVAANREEEMKVVGRATPFQRTTDPLTNCCHWRLS